MTQLAKDYNDSDLLLDSHYETLKNQAKFLNKVMLPI
jgi:hypothetical protein